MSVVRIEIAAPEAAETRHVVNRDIGDEQNTATAKIDSNPLCASAVTQLYYRKFRIAEAIQTLFFRFRPLPSSHLIV
jgi:hypothetical protein